MALKEQFIRISRFIGEENVELLGRKTVAIAGIGAVGGFALEALARSGVGRFRLMDFDVITESNINRQLLALHSTVGELKTEAARRRLLDINPDCIVETYAEFVSEENHEKLFEGADVVLDCIDSLNPKVSLLKAAYDSDVTIISSMGAALRRNVSLVQTGDIFDTWGCPLARQVRSNLRKRGVGRGIECVFSPEKVNFHYVDPEKDTEAERMIDRGRKRVVLGSLPTVTAVFGEYMADLALKKLLPEGTLHGEAEWKPN